MRFGGADLAQWIQALGGVLGGTKRRRSWRRVVGVAVMARGGLDGDFEFGAGRPGD